jgi:ferredoxin-NADP reductase
MIVAAPPTTYLVKLKIRHEVALETMAFHFEKPAGFCFTPGQSIDMTLTNPHETDAEGNMRSFSIASAPHEDMLMVATRMRSTAFKRVLATMPLGSEVTIESPSGDLTLHHDVARTAVFLAGGIGITPFRSMLVWAAKEQLPQHLVLFYSNRRPEDAPFLDELHTLAKKNPNYMLIATMTDMAKSHQPWSGETGQVSKDMLSKYVNGATSPIYYIAGPPAMVKGLHATLNKAGVGDGDIRTEEFAGY